MEECEQFPLNMHEECEEFPLNMHAQRSNLLSKRGTQKGMMANHFDYFMTPKTMTFYLLIGLDIYILEVCYQMLSKYINNRVGAVIKTHYDLNEDLNSNPRHNSTWKSKYDCV